MIRRLIKSLFILFLIVGCAVKLEISTKNSKEWCLNKCEKYDYPDFILAPMLITDYESPKCICMTECMKLDSTYCVESNKP